jgi:hypothetical protein
MADLRPSASGHFATVAQAVSFPVKETVLKENFRQFVGR